MNHFHKKYIIGKCFLKETPVFILFILLFNREKRCILKIKMFLFAGIIIKNNEKTGEWQKINVLKSTCQNH